MKKIIAMLLILSMAFSISAYASDPNIDGGGGGTEDGTGENFWSTGNDGVRVTIVKESTKKAVTEPVDFTNVSSPNVNFCFGLVSKLDYNNGKALSPMLGSNYTWVNPATPIPPIVSASGGTNIAAVKEYFGRSGTIQDIADKTGFKYSDLISGQYVIMLEPIVYITYNGAKFAMTATEAALQDFNEDGALKNKLGFITHQNLPLAMFLEKPDLGYPAWSGATSGIRANSEIISQLGIGTVRFTEGACCEHDLDCPCIDKPSKPNDCQCKEKHPDVPCSPDIPECDCKPPPKGDGSGGGTVSYDYHTDTDVISSLYIYDRTGNKDGVNPDANATVRFTVGGNTYTKSYVVPPNDSTLVWFKWHTPKTPQTMTISVSVTGGGSIDQSTITASVTELKENEPPDPKPKDVKPNFKVPTVPNKADIKSLTWGIWKPWWYEYWVWEENWVDVGGTCDCEKECVSDHSSWEDQGEWVDMGWWEYDYEERKASATTTLTIKPSEEVPTAIQNGSRWEIKSGYGVNLLLEGAVSTTGSSEDVTAMQNTVATFPEFDYKTYDRILEKEFSNFQTKFQLKVNRYSFKKARSHYTPIWFPDNKKYEPQLVTFDAWCPAGQLYLYKSDYVNINGDVYDDWNVSPVKE